MVPLFFVQKIPNCNIPEEMRIYKETTGRKAVKGITKLLGVMKVKEILLYIPMICRQFIIWLNMNKVSVFHGFQKRWQMPDAKWVKIP